MYIHGVYAYKARGTVAESPVTLGWVFQGDRQPLADPFSNACR